MTPGDSDERIPPYQNEDSLEVSEVSAGYKPVQSITKRPDAEVAYPPVAGRLLFVLFFAASLVATAAIWASYQGNRSLVELLQSMLTSILVLLGTSVGLYYSHTLPRSVVARDTTNTFGSRVYRWLAQAPIFIMIVVGLSIIGLCKFILHGHETWYTTPLTALAAAYGAFLAATWVEYAYRVKHSPPERTDAQITASVDRLLREAREAIDRNNDLVVSSAFPAPPNRRLRY